MIAKLGVRLPKGLSIILIALAIAGCRGEVEKAVQPQKPAAPTAPTAPTAPEALKSLPTVTLTGTKVQQIADKPFERVVITASGAFGSNVVRKSDPERIIVIMHNAKIGEAPKSIEVNDGTISRVEIAQLDTGKGSAVRVTIGLAQKTTFEVVSAESALMIDIQKKK